MSEQEIDNAIELLYKWAQERLSSKQEPPWAATQYEALANILISVKHSRESVIFLEDLQQLDLLEENALPQEENIVHLDSFRPHPSNVEVCLPM